MIYVKYWTRRDGPEFFLYKGVFLFGFIPLFVRRTNR